MPFIQKHVGQTSKKMIEMKTFQQILKIVPEFYTHEWVKQVGKEAFLKIDFPASYKAICDALMNGSSLVKVEEGTSEQKVDLGYLKKRNQIMRLKMFKMQLNLQKAFVNKHCPDWSS